MSYNVKLLLMIGIYFGMFYVALYCLMRRVEKLEEFRRRIEADRD